MALTNPYRLIDHRAQPACRGSVQQGLSDAGGALGFHQLGRAADKRYSLGITDNMSAFPSIFLSYTSSDRQFAMRLAGTLRSVGVTVWIDQGEIKIGDSFIAKIQSGLVGTTHLGVILSPRAVRSVWVQRELEYAIAREIDGSGAKVLPLLLETCDLPPFLRSKVYADFRDHADYLTTVNRLLETLEVAHRFTTHDTLFQTIDLQLIPHVVQIIEALKPKHKGLYFGTKSIVHTDTEVIEGHPYIFEHKVATVTFPIVPLISAALGALDSGSVSYECHGERHFVHESFDDYMGNHATFRNETINVVVQVTLRISAGDPELSWLVLPPA